MNKKTVLIVDDDVNIRKMLGEHLRRAGIDSREATTGQEALESVQAAPPDLIVLDLMMPEMDGFSFCSRIKDDPATADIPVVILSGHSADTQRITGKILGAVDFVAKPFNTRDFIENIKSRLGL